jgi:hypothetical protein
MTARYRPETGQEMVTSAKIVKEPEGNACWQPNGGTCW